MQNETHTGWLSQIVPEGRYTDDELDAQTCVRLSRADTERVEEGDVKPLVAHATRMRQHAPLSPEHPNARDRFKVDILDADGVVLGCVG
jgi:hypothetical protein